MRRSEACTRAGAKARRGREDGDAPGGGAATWSCLRLASSAMGTRFELVLVDDGRGDARLRAAGESALAEIAECDARLSRFRRDSAIAFIEREAVDRAVPLDEPTFALFAEALDVWERSGGLFDLAVGGAMERWGLHPQSDRAARESDRDARGSDRAARGPDRAAGAEESAPAGDEPRSALDDEVRTTMPPFALDAARRTIRLLRPDVHLDLGGIAKGHALDLAADVLREAGVRAALLHGGTSAIVAIGAPPEVDRLTTDAARRGAHVGAAMHAHAGIDARAGDDDHGHDHDHDHDDACDDGWTIAIAAGSNGDADRPRLHVRLRDAAMCVSAPHGRVADGAHHILDPRTGAPAALGEIAELAAIVGPRARGCDAWTKPALLRRTRPSGLPHDLTSIVIEAGRVDIQGPARDACCRLRP